MGTNLLVVLLMLVGGWVDEEIGCFELKKISMFDNMICFPNLFKSQYFPHIA